MGLFDEKNLYYIDFYCYYGNENEKEVQRVEIKKEDVSEDELMGISSVLYQLSLDLQKRESTSCRFRYADYSTNEVLTLCLTKIVGYKTNIPNYEILEK